MVRGRPATWIVVRNIEYDVKMAGGRKSGPEYEESTEKSTPEKVGNDRKGRNVKRHGNEEENKGNKPRKGGNAKRGTETKM